MGFLPRARRIAPRPCAIAHAHILRRSKSSSPGRGCDSFDPTLGLAADEAERSGAKSARLVGCSLASASPRSGPFRRRRSSRSAVRSSRTSRSSPTRASTSSPIKSGCAHPEPAYVEAALPRCRSVPELGVPEAESRSWMSSHRRPSACATASLGAFTPEHPTVIWIFANWTRLEELRRVVRHEAAHLRVRPDAHGGGIVRSRRTVRRLRAQVRARFLSKRSLADRLGRDHALAGLLRMRASIRSLPRGAYP